jgi:hypothetical protein
MAQNITGFQAVFLSYFSSAPTFSHLARSVFFYPRSGVADDFESLECDTLSIVKRSNMVSHWLFLLDCLTASEKDNTALGGSGSQSPGYSASDRRKYEYPFSRFILLFLLNKYTRLDSHGTWR